MLLTRAPLYIIRLTMPNQETLYEVAKRVATITLNRPDKLNAWTAVMEQEVRAAMMDAEVEARERYAVRTARCAKLQLARRRRNEEGRSMRHPVASSCVSAEQPALAREQAEADHARQLAEAAQAALFPKRKRR